MIHPDRAGLPTQTTRPHEAPTAPAFDLDAALEEATVAMRRASAAGKDTRALSQGEREAALASLSRALGLNPLTNPVRFIALQGGEALYVTRQATDQIAARLKINRETIVGPEIRDIGGVKMVFCQVRASEPGPNGRSDVATATLPLKDPCNDLMKCETKGKRRATLSLVGLGLLTEDDAEAARDSDAVLAGGDPTEAWLGDLATVGRVHELRAVYAAHSRAVSVTGRDGRHDVRAWLRARGLCAVDAEVTSILSTMPAALAEALDLAALEPNAEKPEPKPDADALVRAARRALAVATDEHSTKMARTILARSYGEALNLSIKEAGAAIKAACEKPEPDDEPDPTPPTGTDGTPSREPGEDDGEDPAGYEAARSAQGAQASAEHAWRDTREGITAHVATLGAKHVENSGRVHLRAIRPELQRHALNAYAERARVLSRRTERDEGGEEVVTEMPGAECLARAESWLREGPRVATLATGQRKRNAA